MNRLIRIGILWCFAISIGRAQEAAKFIEASQTPTLETEQSSSLPASEPTPVNGQPSPYRPLKSEPPRRVAEPKRIVIHPGVDALESEVAMQFIDDLEKDGIAKISRTEITLTSGSPIQAELFMREDESFEKIKQLIVVLRHSGLEQMVMEFGGIHPEGRAEQDNGLVFRTNPGFSQDELQKLELAARKAAEDCGLSLHFAGTVVAPSEPASSGLPDKKPSDLDAEGYAPGPESPQPVTKSVLPSSKAIVLVIDADAQKSEVVKEVIAALEKAGIATGKAAETAPPTNSPISVTLNMRKDESYDKIKQLIEALKSAGVQQMSIREGGVQYQGKEINQLKVNRQPGYSPAEYEKIDLAAIAIMDQCGLSLLREVNWMPGKADERNPFDDANLPVSDSSERTNPALDSGFIPKSSQTADLRTQYEAANKQAHDLAESLRQKPDAARKSELRTAVQRAFTLRQSLLRAELQEMQTRLEKTQQSLAMRDRMADEIVDRRVEDLLNPQLKWDGDGATGQPTTQLDLPNGTTLLRPASGDSKAAILAKLQGTWNVELDAADIEFPGTRAEFTIERNLLKLWEIIPAQPGLTTETIRAEAGAMLLTLGAAGPPQQIDLVIGPNDGNQRRETQGIIEITGDTVKLCYDPQLAKGKIKRPVAFADGTHATLWTLSRSQASVQAAELEGDWHLVSVTDKNGQSEEISPANMSFRKDRYTYADQDFQIDRRIEVYRDKKEIRFFVNGNDAYSEAQYILDGDQLTIVDESQQRVHARGHAPLPKTIPRATEEQKSRWRSGIVEIIGQHRQNSADLQEPKGYGVVVSAQGLIVSQLKSSEGDWLFFAKFDDGGLIPIKLVEEGMQGWGVFQPEQPIETNHHYRLSEATVGQHDEVHFWGQTAKVSETPTLGLFKTTVNDLDRKSPARGQTVWQLFRYNKLDGSLPVLDSNGDLLAITIAGTNDLLLAVPVAQLKTMFPKSFGPAEQKAE